MPNKYDIGTRLNLRTQDRYRQTDRQSVSFVKQSSPDIININNKLNFTVALLLSCDNLVLKLLSFTKERREYRESKQRI